MTTAVTPSDANAPVQLRAEGAVRIITLNRPRELNALNEPTLRLLDETVQRLAQDSAVGALIITGAGRSFVAGADVNAFVGRTPAELAQLARLGQTAFNHIEQFPKPVIGLINGFCLGGGHELAMATHYRIATENAQFGQPEVTLGILPGFGATQRLPLIVGPWEAAELLANGDNLSPADAQGLGLVHEVVPAAHGLSRTLLLAQAWVAGTAKAPDRPDWRLRAAAQNTEFQCLFATAAMRELMATPEPQDPSDREAARRWAARNALEAMRTGYQRGFSAGLEAEAEIFGKVLAGPSGQHWVGQFLKRDPRQRERSVVLDLASAAPPPSGVDTFTMPGDLGEFYQSAAAILGIVKPVPLDSAAAVKRALVRSNGAPQEAGERLMAYEQFILEHNPSAALGQAVTELGPLPVGKLVAPGQPIPLLRWAWTLDADTPPSNPPDAFRLTVRSTPEVRVDEVLILALGSAAEANAGRWLPQRRPADILAAHGQRFHTPGNNAVGLVVAAGEEAARHYPVGKLVVTHNSSAEQPLGSRILRDDPDMEGMVIRGYDEFRARPDAPIRSGAHAQFVTAKWLETVSKPDKLTIEESVVWALPDPTIRHNFRINRLAAGETLLLIGASGSTGIRGIEIAKSMGVRRVIGLVSEPDKAEDIRRRSTATFDVVPILRTQFDFTTPEGRAQFVAKVRELNGGQPADVALDFLGSFYPQTFLAAVKRGDPNDPHSLGGRFTSYGAELGHMVSFEGTEGATMPDQMFQRVEHFRNVPGTEEVLAAALRMSGNDPEWAQAVERARASAEQDRKIRRVVVWGGDIFAQVSLYNVERRGAKAVVLVNGEEQAQAARTAFVAQRAVREALAAEPERAIIDLAPYLRDGRLDDRSLLNDIRSILGDRPDLVVERADQTAVLGIPNGEQTLGMSLNWLRPGGQVIFFERTAGHAYQYDIRAWVTQKDILLPDCSIILTHYASQAVCYMSWEAVQDGTVSIDPPHLFPWAEVPTALDTQGRGKNVILHGIPAGLRTVEEVRAAQGE